MSDNKEIDEKDKMLYKMAWLLLVITHVKV